MKILYFSSFLPKRSETFVYKEVLGLQARGVAVGVGSLYPPEKNLGEDALDQMAAQVTTVYGQGYFSLFWDAFRFILCHPWRSIAVMTRAKLDAVFADDMPWKERPKVVFQGLAALAFAHRIAGKGYTRVHIHMAHSATTVGMYVAQALGIPFSFTGHAADIFRERCLLKIKLQRAAFVACISEWHREWYRSICQRDITDYPVIRCGVEIPATPLPLRTTPPFTVLGLGRLVPKKGFDVLIQACRILVNEGLDLECTIAGDGPEEERLKKLAAGLPVKFPGAIANGDVPQLLEGIDVFVLPCQICTDGDRDGIPVVLMEAMAAGVCVVSGDLPTIRELIHHEKTGILISPGDPEKCADALRNLARNPDLRNTLAKEGRKRVEEEFSSSKNLDRILAAFTDK